MPRRRPLLTLDFDGVLNNYRGWEGPTILGQPASGVEDFLDELVARGYKLVICTTRPPHMVKEWLEATGLSPYIHDVTNTKQPSVLHIDDRTICHTGDFALTLQKIAEFKVWWEKEDE